MRHYVGIQKFANQYKSGIRKPTYLLLTLMKERHNIDTEMDIIITIIRRTT